MPWLVRDGDVLAAAALADTARARRRGLLGRDTFDGALVLRPCRNVHTARMRFAIDVAFCNAEGVVLRTVSLAPWRLSPYVHRAAFAIEAESGAFDRWQLKPGDRVELRA
jgi:uncharacterized membrane protein (UPF0127 family)